MVSPRVFLLSPAYAGGKRARLLVRGDAEFELASKLRVGRATVGEVFAFLSGLYFRGKLAYASAFAAPPGGQPGALIITARGLVPPDAAITIDGLSELAAADIHESNEAYRSALERDAACLATRCGDARMILLGSIATAKYIEPLTNVCGERLVFPQAFVGRGDMSRGGLMLRAAAAGVELEYVPVLGAVRRGKRPPRLEPRK